MLAERHQAEAARERREASSIVRPQADLRLHPDTEALNHQVSAALLHLAGVRERLATSLNGAIDQPQD